MLAVPERVQGRTVWTETVVWHKPVGRVTEEFQAIACSDTDGITFPPPKQDVPLSLDKPGEDWCPDCLVAIRAALDTPAPASGIYAPDPGCETRDVRTCTTACPVHGDPAPAGTTKEN